MCNWGYVILFVAALLSNLGFSMDKGPAPLASNSIPTNYKNPAIFVGITQEGKTTLVESILDYAQVPHGELKKGTGAYSVTIESQEYLIGELCLKKAKIPSISSQADLELFLDNKYSYDLDFATDRLPGFTLIDTPGLEDSRGEEYVQKNIINIARKIYDVGAICCVVMVMKKTSVYTKKYRDIYAYLMNYLKPLNTPFIIVHSAFDILESEYFPNRTKKANMVRDFLPLGKNQGFYQVFINSCGWEGRLYKEYIQHCEAFKTNGINELLHEIQSCSTCSTKNLLLLKTEKMRYLDSLVLGWLDSENCGLISTLHIASKVNRDFMIKVIKLAEELGRLTFLAEALRNNLNALQSDQTVDFMTSTGKISVQQKEFNKDEIAQLLKEQEETVEKIKTTYQEFSQSFVSGIEGLSYLVTSKVPEKSNEYAVLVLRDNALIQYHDKREFVLSNNIEETPFKDLVFDGRSYQPTWEDVLWIGKSGGYIGVEKRLRQQLGYKVAIKALIKTSLQHDRLTFDEYIKVYEPYIAQSKPDIASLRAVVEAFHAKKEYQYLSEDL